jgi:nitrogen-specific signal transduction histidine kinase
MSRIYTNLLQVEMEKQGWVSGETTLKGPEEKVIPLEAVAGPKNGDDKKELVSDAREKSPQNGQNGRAMPSVFNDLAHHIKQSLGTIRNLTEFSQGRFKDSEFGYYFHRMVTEDIDKTEAELNCFLDYLKMKSPVPRANTVHLILEDLLRKSERRLAEKKIKVVRKQFEKDLPETSVPDEELKYILHWVLQYALTSVTSNGTLGLLTRSFDPQESKDDIKSTFNKDGKYLEILVAFGGNEKPNEQPVATLGLQTLQRENGTSLILPLVEEIVQKNRGTLKLKFDPEKRLTQISLMLPSERRKVLHYQTGQA